jgi:acetoin utilization deacetylase AcuC-like enzyme
LTAILHAPEAFAPHDQRGHAENQQRLARIAVPGDRPRIPLRPATDAELLAVHSAAHLRTVAGVCAAGGGMLDPDTYCLPESEAVVRAIVDFDVHHGNGTQDIFCEDADVLYLSSHQYPHYPYTGAATERGRGPGLGTTVNHPLSEGSGDAEFLAAYRDHLLPALAAFGPDIVLVSAGFDAHVADPLAVLLVTDQGFAALLDLLLQAAEVLCGGRIVFSLEGGYDPAALAHGVQATIRALSAFDSAGRRPTATPDRNGSPCWTS